MAGLITIEGDTLAASSADFSVETATINDNVLGAEYQSTWPGLKSWTLSSPFFMKGYHAWKSALTNSDSGGDMEGTNFEMSLSADTVDITTFTAARSNGGWSVKAPALREVELTMGGFDNKIALDALDGTIPVSIDLGDAGAAGSLSGTFVITEDSLSDEVGPPTSNELTLALYVQPDGTVDFTGSVTDSALSTLLSAFMNDTVINVSRGDYSGDAIVTGLSFSASVDGALEGNVELAGRGALSGTGDSSSGIFF